MVPTQPRRVEPLPETRARAPAEPAGDPAQASPSRATRQGGIAAPAPPEEASPAPPASPPGLPAEPPRATRSRPPSEPLEERRPRTSDEAGAAEELAAAYLAYWSAPNAVTLDATPEFYAPQVLFHGRQMSARALFEEKRRFVRRWPVRDYRPRVETVRTTCDPAPPICTVRTVFDFAASNPQSGSRSQGTALLQLGVSFADGEPRIVFETSQVTSRARSARSEAFEDDEDDRN